MANHVKIGVDPDYTPGDCPDCGTTLELDDEGESGDRKDLVYKCSYSEIIVHLHKDSKTGAFIQAKANCEGCLWCNPKESPTAIHKQLVEFVEWFEKTYPSTAATQGWSELASTAMREHKEALGDLEACDADTTAMEDDTGVLACASIVMAYARACTWLNRPNAFAKRPSGAKKAKTH
jgi:hypothetical protein